MLSEIQVREFQRIYKDRFGKAIGQKEAIEKGITLIRLMELTYKRMTIEEQAELQERIKQTNKINL